MTVGRVIFHHEGAGGPDGSLDRPLHEHYSISVNRSGYKMNLQPEQSFITKGTKGHSLQVVFVGNREIYQVLGAEIAYAVEAVEEARRRKWVNNGALVVTDHKTASGKAMITECPGDYVEASMPSLEFFINHKLVTAPPVEGHTVAKVVRVLYEGNKELIITDSGNTYAFGDMPYIGGVGNVALAKPIVDGTLHFGHEGNIDGLTLWGEDGGRFPLGKAPANGNIANGESGSLAGLI